MAPRVPPPAHPRRSARRGPPPCQRYRTSLRLAAGPSWGWRRPWAGCQTRWPAAASWRGRSCGGRRQGGSDARDRGINLVRAGGGEKAHVEGVRVTKAAESLPAKSRKAAVWCAAAQHESPLPLACSPGRPAAAAAAPAIPRPAAAAPPLPALVAAAAAPPALVALPVPAQHSTAQRSGWLLALPKLRGFPAQPCASPRAARPAWPCSEHSAACAAGLELAPPTCASPARPARAPAVPADPAPPPAPPHVAAVSVAVAPLGAGATGPALLAQAHASLAGDRAHRL